MEKGLALGGWVGEIGRMFEVEEYLDPGHTAHRGIFEGVGRVWEVLSKIGPYLQFRLEPGLHGELIGKPFVGPRVYIGEGTVVEPGATIKGPAWIGRGCQIRSGCYIRENVILGDGVVAGNSSEFKNCLVFDGAEVPHFNYVGDSVLGYRAHLGAGVILSNVRLDRGEVVVTGPGGAVPTGLKKFGAVVGDHAEVGCNAVLSPGSLIGKRSLVYPGVQWRGVLPAHRIARLRQEIDVVPRRE